MVSIWICGLGPLVIFFFFLKSCGDRVLESPDGRVHRVVGGWSAVVAMSRVGLILRCQRYQKEVRVLDSELFGTILIPASISVVILL